MFPKLVPNKQGAVREAVGGGRQEPGLAGDLWAPDDGASSRLHTWCLISALTVILFVILHRAIDTH